MCAEIFERSHRGGWCYRPLVCCTAVRVSQRAFRRTFNFCKESLYLHNVGVQKAIMMSHAHEILIGAS